MGLIEEKVIELSKKKILLLILGSCIFVAGGAWLLSLDEAAIQSSKLLLVHGIGVASIVFFGVCAIFYVKKLFDKKAGLVFNSSGVIDNSSGVAAGLIPWSEILGTDIFEMNGQKMLVIKVRHPQKYIERGGRLKQVLNKANYKMCGSPIIISSTALKISFSELVSLFDQYKQKYSNA